MATKDERPGLLSKVAKFVRNPTVDWAALDQPDTEQQSGYDKQALKAMIERRKQNDFIRKREFDQLRKLRSRDPSAIAAAAARPSFFQSSLPTDPDGRAVTLKKIDEIEAQMSRQWWKGKADGGADATIPAGAGLSPAEQAKADAAHAAGEGAAGNAAFAPTQVGPATQQGAPSTDFAPTVVGSGMVGLPPAKGDKPAKTQLHGKAPLMSAMLDGFDSADINFSTSKLFAIEAEEMATDPELEEAAIRFANGEDSQAEAGLLQSLRADAIEPDSARAWSAALLDLYRATNQRSAFDRALVEFAYRLDGTSPQWLDLTAVPGIAPVQAATPVMPVPAAVQASAQSIWKSPVHLDSIAMEHLRNAMSDNPVPWQLDWSRLEDIDAEAMPFLSGLFASLCSEPVSLKFVGAQALVQTLRRTMPSGNRNVPQSWWVVRLNALRVMQMHDDFELAALDYCVTFETDPPVWVDPTCTCTLQEPGFDTTVVAPEPSTQGGASTVFLDPEGKRVPSIELVGAVLGDALDLLSSKDAIPLRGVRLVIDCSRLIRVDFAAAGSILNWVASRQAEGMQVQFRDVNRLVATFFNVIGITEHARVIPRAI